MKEFSKPVIFINAINAFTCYLFFYGLKKILALVD